MNEALRIVVVAPDLVVIDPSDDHAISQAERSRSLRIGLFIVDAESDAQDALGHVVIAMRDARPAAQSRDGQKPQTH